MNDFSRKEEPDLISYKAVKDALKKVRSLYELENHPLAGLNIVEKRVRSGKCKTRGGALQNLLREAIEQLKPSEPIDEDKLHKHTKAQRPYLVLIMTYLDGLPRTTICHDLSISEREQ